MIGFLQALPDEEVYYSKFGFLAAHVLAKHSNKYTEMLDDILRCISNVREHIKYAEKHTMLCILHPRDYTVRDWRSLSVGSLIHAELTKISLVHYLTQVTLWDSGRQQFNGRMRPDGHVRPFFPFRSTMEMSFYLINRDDHGTYDKWMSKKNMMESVKRTNVWRAELMVDSYTPSLAVYQNILELFCHPNRVILDIMPHTGGFASAASMLNLDYVGICNPTETVMIKRRIQKIREAKADEIITRLMATPDRVSRINKTSRVFGRWGGLR
jgi:hypothetical protein